MTRLRFPRCIALALILAAFLVIPASGAEVSRGGFNSSSVNLRIPLWHLLTGLWAKAGCVIDPNGSCRPIQSKEGCVIDPDGRCRVAPVRSSADAGCDIDPSGRCLPGH